MKRMKVASQAIADIIQTYTKLMYHSKGQTQKDSVYNACQKAYEIFREQLENQKVEFILSENTRTTMVDINLSNLILSISNLISNSCDAIAGQDKKWIKISAEDYKGRVKIDFQDSGDGIPKEIQAKIFNRQFTTKEQGKGTGLGLHLVKTLIEDEGGEIEYLPGLSHTTFRILF